jgi:hypothetical protein
MALEAEAVLDMVISSMKTVMATMIMHPMMMAMVSRIMLMKIT